MFRVVPVKYPLIVCTYGYTRPARFKLHDRWEVQYDVKDPTTVTECVWSGTIRSFFHKTYFHSNGARTTLIPCLYVPVTIFVLVTVILTGTAQLVDDTQLFLISIEILMQKLVDRIANAH